MPKARLNPGPAATAAIAPVTECPKCRQWEPSADDGYCAFCGHLLLSLTVEPDSLLLISTLAPRRSLALRNSGEFPLHVAIVSPSSAAQTGVVFEPAAFDIPADQEVQVQVELDASSPLAGTETRALDFVCRVDDDPRKQLPFKVLLRSGPRPTPLPATLSFGEVQEGTSNERLLAIANHGGTPLNVQAVRIEGTSQLRLKTEFKPMVVAPAKRLEIAVLWDGRSGSRVTEGDAAGLHFRFGNYPHELFVPVQASTFRCLLELRPPAIRLSQVLAKGDQATRVEMANLGTIDLEIERIETDQPWLEVISRAASFTLLRAEPPGQRSIAISPTTFAGSYEFKVVVHPRELPPGRHQGRVSIRLAGQEPKSLGVDLQVIEPTPYPDYVGIDFGTSNSVVGVFDQERHEIDLVTDSSSPLIPSILVFEDAETYIIGQSAKNAMGAASDRTVRSIKRIMGYDQEREFFGRRFTPEELAACIIRKLVQMTESQLHKASGRYYDVRKAIITVPANFFDLQIRGVLAACKLAGIDTEEEKVLQAAQAMSQAIGQAVNAGIILDEPSAAVLYYIYHLSQSRGASSLMQAIDREGGLRLLVFDYGGGTLDVSVANVIRLENREAGLRILANMGDNRIGGDTIDLILMRDLLDRCADQAPGAGFEKDLISEPFKALDLRRDREAWSLDAWRQVLHVRGEWKDLAESVKVQLSEREQMDVEILPHQIVRLVDGRIQPAPRGVKLTISRAKLADLLQGIRKSCTTLVESCLDLAGLAPTSVDYILHTGRQSLLPFIRQSLREVFPNLPPECDILEPEHLKVCVAKGAALYGWMRDKLVDPQARIHFLSEGRRLPHSYGVEKFTALMQPEFDEVIPRGSCHPTVAEKSYPPEMIPPGGHLNLKFYQNTGTLKQIVRNPQVSLVGQISINTLADGEPGCVVRFVIDANRKLEVFADGQEVPISPVRLRGEESWMG